MAKKAAKRAKPRQLWAVLRGSKSWSDVEFHSRKPKVTTNPYYDGEFDTTSSSYLYEVCIAGLTKATGLKLKPGVPVRLKVSVVK